MGCAVSSGLRRFGTCALRSRSSRATIELVSRIDDALASFQHNPKVPETYDSLVDKLPVKEETKAGIRDGGRSVGTGFMIGLRKITQVVEGAIDGGVAGATGPLNTPSDAAPRASQADEGPASPMAGDPAEPSDGAASPANAQTPSSEAPTTAAGVVDELERLALIYRSGGLTDEEYAQAKAKLLSF